MNSLKQRFLNSLSIFHNMLLRFLCKIELSKICIIFCGLLLLSSCTIEKRIHQKGYYVNFLNCTNRINVTTDHHNPSNPITKEIFPVFGDIGSQIQPNVEDRTLPTKTSCKDSLEKSSSSVQFQNGVFLHTVTGELPYEPNLESEIDTDFVAKRELKSRRSLARGKRSLIYNVAGQLVSMRYLAMGKNSLDFAFFAIELGVWFSILVSIIGIIIGISVLRSAKKEDLSVETKKTAKWGIILCSISLLGAIGYTMLVFGLGWL